MGPGAASLILIVVVLSLCMLAMLMQITARNDYNLTRRSASTISRVYELSAKAEEKLAILDGILVECARETDGRDMEDYLDRIRNNLPEGYTIWDDEVTWEDPLDNRTLTCTIKVLPLNAGDRFEWVRHTLAVIEPEEDILEEPEEETDDGDT